MRNELLYVTCIQSVGIFGKGIFNAKTPAGAVGGAELPQTTVNIVNIMNIAERMDCAVTVCIVLD